MEANSSEELETPRKPSGRSIGGVYDAWSRFGFPPTYLGKWLVLATVTLLGPLSLLRWWMQGSLSTPLWWSAVGTGLILFVLAGQALLRPLRMADEELSRTLAAPGGDRRDVASRLYGLASTVSQHAKLRAGFLAGLAGLDFTTGLGNRATAIERLRQNRQLALRDHLPLTAALLDVEPWSANSDGHEDRELLAGVSYSVDQQLRDSDWAARWSEDQLLLVLFTDADGAEVALRRIVSELLGLRVLVGEEERGWRGVVGAAQLRVGESFADWMRRTAVAHGMARGEESGLIIDD